MNEKQKNSILIVFGCFVLLAGLPKYVRSNSLEDLFIYIIPGLIIIGIGVFRIFASKRER